MLLFPLLVAGRALGLDQMVVRILVVEVKVCAKESYHDPAAQILKLKILRTGNGIDI